MFTKIGTKFSAGVLVVFFFSLDPNQDPEIYSYCKTHAFKQTRRKEAYQQVK